MYFTYKDYKLAVYWALGLVGLALLVLGLISGQECRDAAEPVSFHLTALILLLVSVVDTIFCIELFVRRDESGCWK